MLSRVGGRFVAFEKEGTHSLSLQCPRRILGVSHRNHAMIVHHMICLFEETANCAAARNEKGIAEEEYHDMVQSAFRRCEEEVQERIEAKSIVTLYRTTKHVCMQ